MGVCSQRAKGDSAASELDELDRIQVAKPGVASWPALNFESKDSSQVAQFVILQDGTALAASRLYLREVKLLIDALR